MSEYIKAIKLIHQIVILTAAAVLAFALTPNRGPKLEAADTTLNLLQEQTEDSWNEFVYDLQKDNQTTQSEYVNELAAKLDPSHRSALYPMFIYSDLRYPLNGTLSSIRRYLETKQTLQLASLKREPAALMKQWLQSFPTPAPGALLKPADIHAVISDINIVPPGGGWTGNAYSKVRLLNLAQANADKSSRIQIVINPTSPSQPTTNNHVVDLVTSCELKEPIYNYYALLWLLIDRYRFPGSGGDRNEDHSDDKLGLQQNEVRRRAHELLGEHRRKSIGQKMQITE